jgi:hypothetical protein
VVLLGSRGSGVPGACCCGAKKAFDLLDALPSYLVYPRLGKPQLKSGVPAVRVEWQQSCYRTLSKPLSTSVGH